MKNLNTNITLNVRSGGGALLRYFEDGAKLEFVPTKDGVFVRKARLSYRERHTKAEGVLGHYLARRAEFMHTGDTSCCVVELNGRTKVGVSVCAPDDEFDMVVGRAIAFERALYGKVKTKELL